jgi:hypothetical protein
MNGKTGLSVGRITFGRNRRSSIRRAVEDIEHLLIWALTPSENESKNFTLPCAGEREAPAWHIENDGYEFFGQMPSEIVYPWMLIKVRRDRSAR